jgi:hypothetical protein
MDDMRYMGVAIRPEDKVWWARPDGESVAWIVHSRLSSNDYRLRMQRDGWTIVGHEPFQSKH